MRAVVLAAIVALLAACAVDGRRAEALAVLDKCEAAGGCVVIPDDQFELLLEYIKQLEDAIVDSAGKQGV